MRKSLLILLIVMIAATVVTAAEVVTVDGQDQVLNGSKPRDGIQDISLKELWRVGGEDEEVFFGVVTQVETDDAGNLYLLDTQLSQVMVFNTEGEFTGTISREGDGPGEVRMPADMCFMPDGSLGLMQSFPGKVTKVSLDDEPVGTIVPGEDAQVGGFLMMRDINTAGNILVGCGEKISPFEDQSGQTRTSFLSAFDAEGKKLHDYLTFSRDWLWADMVWNETNEYFVHYRKWDAGEDGKVYAAAKRNNYEVHVWNNDGTPVHVIKRDYERLERDAETLARVEEGMENLKRQFGPITVKTETETTEQDIISLFVHPSGELWVLSSQGQANRPDGVLSSYDVFDTNGEFIRQVRVHAPGDGAEDAVMFARDGRVLVVTGFTAAVTALQGGGGASDEEEEPAPMEVICYSVK
jgi:hypothetical protein